MADEKKIEGAHIVTNEEGVATGTGNSAVKSGVELAGDSGQRVDDGTKEGGIITKDLVDGKKEADKLNKQYGIPGY